MRFVISVGLIAFAMTLVAQTHFTDRSVASTPESIRGNYGVAVGDYNNDGWEDLFISRTGSESNVLLKNDGKGQFIDVSHIISTPSNFTSVALWVDYNNDGFLDLFTANVAYEPNRLLRNNGDETFTDVSTEAGITHNTKLPQSVNAADLNGDGFLDLYLNNFKEENLLYLNQGDGTFAERATTSGLSSLGHAMGMVMVDYDNDMDIDIYMVFDGQPFRLMQNDGQGTFTDVSEISGANYDGFGMGVDIADINHDGYFDLYITNLYENTLLLGSQNMVFSDISTSAGIQDLGMGWGITFLDYDNDTFEDIYVINEYGFLPDDNVLYRNMGDLTFTKLEDEVLKSPYSGFGSATLDYDLDGKQDVVIANTNHHLQIIQNQCEVNNWVKFKLLDMDANVHAIGARVKIYLENVVLMDQITAGNSYSSQSSNIVHFGIGFAELVNKVEVFWPDGTYQVFEDVRKNTFYLVEKEKSITFFDHNNYNDLFSSNVILNADLKEKPQVYPNPCSDQVYLDSSLKLNGLYDLSGSKIDVEVLHDHHRQTIQLGHLAPGIYLLQYMTGSSHHLTLKLIKE